MNQNKRQAILTFVTVFQYDIHNFFFNSFHPGTIPIHNPTTGRLQKCDDPIVSTTSLNGYCLWDSHCKNLKNTCCVFDNVQFFTRRLVLYHDYFFQGIG